MNRIADNSTRTKHDEEIGFFNNLVIDLKLQLLARPSREPITMERLEEATRYLSKLSECKERVRFM